MKSFFKKFVVIILTLEARAVITRRKPFIVAVTGSVGKTSTKDAIFEVLRSIEEDKTNIRKSEKSFNSEIGVPLTILGLSNAWYNPIHWFWNILRGAFLIVSPFAYPKTLVLEIGADHPGDIAKTTIWMTPNVTVVTRIPDRPVHVEFFSGPDEVRKEKAELVRALPENGVFVANADDPAVASLSILTKAEMFSYGFKDGADLQGSTPEIMYIAGEYGRVPIGMMFSVVWEHETYKVLSKGVLGAQSSLSALAALAVGIVRSVPIKDAILALERLESPRGRMRIVEGKGATTILDDSYNSSPVAAESALETLRAVEGNHKVALLGDMLELGEYSKEEHWRIGRIAGSFVDTLVVVGERARMIAEAAKTAGLPQEKIHTFADAVSAGEWVSQQLKPGDVILAKGSQGSGANMIRIERAVRILMAHPEQAGEMLVRQERQWQEQYR